MAAATATLIDMYRYALDAVGFDWIGNGDHDNNNGREYPWWITQKTADAYRWATASCPCSRTNGASATKAHRCPFALHRLVEQ